MLHHTLSVTGKNANSSPRLSPQPLKKSIIENLKHTSLQPNYVMRRCKKTIISHWFEPQNTSWKLSPDSHSCMVQMGNNSSMWGFASPLFILWSKSRDLLPSHRASWSHAAVPEKPLRPNTLWTRLQSQWTACCLAVEHSENVFLVVE